MLQNSEGSRSLSEKKWGNGVPPRSPPLHHCDNSNSEDTTKVTIGYIRLDYDYRLQITTVTITLMKYIVKHTIIIQ